MLIAAARLNLPSIFVCAGIMEAGKLDGEAFSLSDLDEKVMGGYPAGRGIPGADRPDGGGSLPHLGSLSADGDGQYHAVSGGGSGDDPARCLHSAGGLL